MKTEMRMETWKLADIHPANYNPRVRLRPGDQEYEDIRRSLENFGYVDPIIVNQDGTIIGGHQRHTVLSDLGYEEAQVVVVDLGKADEKALNVALNKITGKWDTDKLKDLLLDLDEDDYDISLTGFHGEDLKDILDDVKIEETTFEDHYEAQDLPEEPKAQKGQIFQLENHRLMCGDSTDTDDVDALMNGKVADMVFTDPPYALFGNSTGVSDVGDEKMITPFFREIFREIESHVKLMAHAYVCCDWQTCTTIRETSGWMVPKNMIIWRKSEAGGLGSYFTKIYEMIWFFVKDEQTGVTGHKSAKARVIHGLPNIWDFGIVPTTERVHNAQKPVELVARAIKCSADPGEIVLDLFGGSGTTLIAAEQTDRICYIMEQEPKYCDVIIDRWEALTGQKAVVVDG